MDDQPKPITPLTPETALPHQVITVMLDILANPKNHQSYTVLEWMLACHEQGNVTYEQFCQNVKLLRDAGVIRAMGTGYQTNSYVFERQTWNNRQ